LWPFRFPGDISLAVSISGKIFVAVLVSRKLFVAVSISGKIFVAVGVFGGVQFMVYGVGYGHAHQVLGPMCPDTVP